MRDLVSGGAEEGKRVTEMAVAEMTEVERGSRLLTNSYGTAQLELVRGRGCYVWDDQGNRYLDFLAGIAVNALGHAHPALAAAIADQASTLIHVSNFFVSPPQLELAERLLELSGAGENGRVFFANSGAEANEAALKMVRLHATATGHSTVLALDHGFHGRTLGSLSLTANPKYREPFEPLPGNVLRVEPTPQALEEALKAGAAALFLEPIQGEAGVVPLSDDFLRQARELTQKHGALLVVDEVQTGVGRLGDWFGYQRSGITPDIVTLAKGLGGGLPIGAAIAFAPAANLFYPGSHGSTFGGNPLSCRAALTVLNTIIEDDLIANSQKQSSRLSEGILSLGSPLVAGVRGRGLLLAIELSKEVGPQVVKAGLRNGLIINSPRPGLIRLAPPLIVGDAEVQEFLPLFKAALEESAG